MAKIQQLALNEGSKNADQIWKSRAFRVIYMYESLFTSYTYC